MRISSSITDIGVFNSISCPPRSISKVLNYFRTSTFYKIFLSLSLTQQTLHNAQTTSGSHRKWNLEAGAHTFLYRNAEEKWRLSCFSDFQRRLEFAVRYHCFARIQVLKLIFDSTIFFPFLRKPVSTMWSSFLSCYNNLTNLLYQLS